MKNSGKNLLGVQAVNFIWGYFGSCMQVRYRGFKCIVEVVLHND